MPHVPQVLEVVSVVAVSVVAVSVVAVSVVAGPVISASAGSVSVVAVSIEIVSIEFDSTENVDVEANSCRVADIGVVIDFGVVAVGARPSGLVHGQLTL